MYFSIFIIFVDIFINIFCQALNWNIWTLENSSIDLLSSSDSYNYIIYDERDKGIHIKLMKHIWKENGKIYHKNYIQKNDEEEEEIEFDDIYNFYSLENKTYICPKGNNSLFDYSSNTIKIINNTRNTITGNWFLTCGFDNNKLFISYLGSSDNNIYQFNIKQNKWESENLQLYLKDGWMIYRYDCYRYYDIIWPNEDKKYGMALLSDERGIMLAKIQIRYPNSYYRYRQKMLIIIDNKYISINYKLNVSVFFDEERFFYLLAYNESEVVYGYSNSSISDDIQNFNLKDIKLKKMLTYKTNGNVKINYINFIRNTKYIYYEIELNSIIYHGVINIKENQISFNTNETIIDFRPLSKYSLLAIIESSAYEICINGKYNGKCIDECPEGQILVYNEKKGNYCFGKECKNILLKTNNTCVEKCDEQQYILVENECGLCKHLNKTFPYKIINETNCINEKPNNTYFTDEKSYILKYCHYSCETCFGDNETDCFTCRNSFFKNNGKCDSNCPEHHYKNLKEKICSECDSNCKECDNGKENNNSHCLSCEEGQYLVIAKGFDRNCVEECPNNTKLNNDTKECFSETDDTNNKNTDQNNFFKDKTVWIWAAIILISLIIIIVIVIVISKKYCKKKKDDINAILKPEDDFMAGHNDNMSQDWSIY